MIQNYCPEWGLLQINKNITFILLSDRDLFLVIGSFLKESFWRDGKSFLLYAFATVFHLYLSH